MLVNDAPDYRPGAALPGFRPVSDAIRAALPALAPPTRISVSEAATRRQINAGGRWTEWDNAVAPYMVEPMDATLSRRFEAVIFAGPARSSKTEGLIINPFVHAMLCAPRLVSIFHMSQGSAREFSIQDLDPVIRNSPELLARLSKTKGEDNIHDKRFAGGGRLTVDWPVPNKLAGRSIPLVLFSDYDAQDQDVGGEGPPFFLGLKRNTSAGSRGMTVAESSPRFPVEDESWSPKTPHEAPPCGGILGLYNLGSRGRYYWTCPDCGGEFEPLFDRLDYPREGTPTERGEKAVMVCLHCGCVIEPKHKAELNRGGRWLHEGEGGQLVPLQSGLLRATTFLSYWLAGPAAALAPWSRLVARYEAGVEEWETRGSETTLKAAMNLDLGLPHRPRALTESTKLSESALRDGATDHAWQIAPAETRFIQIAVDVQPGRFVVGVVAHLANMERVIIDRFDIHTPPDGSPRAKDRRIDPGRYAEDWAVLLPLADRLYPVANAAHHLKPAAIIIDSAGEPGVTPNAYAFFRSARKTHPRRFWLVRGVGGENAKRAELRAPETAHRGKKHVAKDVQIIFAGNFKLKDEIAASLTREDEGGRSINIPKGAPPEVFAEFASERRTLKGWEKKPGIKRNEALDLAVYDLALAIVLKVEKINWADPPAWAALGPGNSFAVNATAETLAQMARAVSEALAPDTQPETAAAPARRRKTRPRRSFDGW